jgi:hypothetical protein
MSAISKVFDLFRDACPERESKKRLTHAKLTLLEAECNLDYYSANVAMLKARISRLESELKGEVVEVRPDRASIQAPHPGPGYTSTGEAVKEPATRSKRLHATA